MNYKLTIVSYRLATQQMLLPWLSRAAGSEAAIGSPNLENSCHRVRAKPTINSGTEKLTTRPCSVGLEIAGEAQLATNST